LGTRLENAMVLEDKQDKIWYDAEDEFKRNGLMHGGLNEEEGD